MMVRRLLASVALVVLFSGAASAESLNDAMAKAYLNNPDLAAARATLRATDELAPQAMSGYRPTVTANASAGVVTTDRHGAGSDDYTSGSASVTVVQPLYRGGRTVAAVKEADSTIAAQESLLHSTEQSTLLAAVQAYLDVVRDQAVLELNRNNEAVLGRQLQAAQDRFDVGEVTRTDVSQSNARRAGAVAGRVQAEGNLVQSRAAYQRIVGEAPAKLEKANVTLALPKTLDEVVAEAEKANPDYVAADNIRKAADAVLDGVKGERLPTVSLQGTAGRDWTDGSTFTTTDRTDSASATVQLSWPLYSAGSTSSRIREAKQNIQRRSSEVESAHRGVVELSTQAWEQLQTARAVMDSRRTQVSAAQTALDGVQQEALVGSRTVLDTLDAEQELLDAQVALVQAERDVILAQYTVLSAVGRLTARDLTLPVEYYDAKAYAKKVRHKAIGSSVE